jgi:DNA (cytosine-5)-methyltransferase 3A
MNIVSLFDGYSSAQIALNNLGIGYDNYFASEICPHAIKVTQSNFPNTKQLGDVTKVNASKLPKIDFLCGGSPCQGFSFAGKQLNFDDPRSKLFFEFVRLKNELTPQYFFLENVVMKKQFEDVITRYLGVDPIKVNSSLVSAQNRERLYWTNLPSPEIKDLGINLFDILDVDDFQNPSAICGRYLNKATILGRRLDDRGKRQDYNKDVPITQCLEVRATNRNKSNCLTTVAKDNVLTNLPVGRYPNAFKDKLPFRYYTVKEMCRLQTVQEDYFEKSGVSDRQITKMLGNGWTIKVIERFFSNLDELVFNQRSMPLFSIA